MREGQDYGREREVKDKQLIGFKCKPSDQRNAAAETQISDRIAAIDARLVGIVAIFKDKFPDYAALTSPKPATLADVQVALGANEALVLFLDTNDRFKPHPPEETFVW